jgi:hypothetical protein
MLYHDYRFIGEGTHMTISPTTALDFFQAPRVLSSAHDPNQWDGYRQDMSNGLQSGYRAYLSGDKEARCDKGRLRWGYAWNNEGDCSSP